MQKQVSAKRIGEYQRTLMPEIRFQILRHSRHLIRKTQVIEFAARLSASQVKTPTDQNWTKPSIHSTALTGEVVKGFCHAELSPRFLWLIKRPKRITRSEPSDAGDDSFVGLPAYKLPAWQLLFLIARIFKRNVCNVATF